MSNRIEFGTVKLIPIGSVLDRRGIEMKRSGAFLIGKCPLPTHTSKTPDTFKVSIKENWWTCWSESCRAKYGKKGGDVIDLACALWDIAPLEAGKMLGDMFALNRNAPQVAERGHEELPGKNKPLAWTLQGVKPEHPMIQSRGISIETAASWGVGFFSGKGSMENRIVFPLMEDGALVGYAGRAITGEPKWRLGKGIQKTFLYGLERCDPAKPVIVTESCWAPLFFSERKQQAASLMGSVLTEAQEKRLEGFTTIVVAMDNDEKGKEAAEKISIRLREKHRVIRAVLRE